MAKMVVTSSGHS